MFITRKYPRMLEGLLENLLLLIIIFGTPVGILIGGLLEKLLFGDRLDKMGGMMPFLRVSGYAFLWWWFCMWFSVDVLGRSF